MFPPTTVTVPGNAIPVCPLPSKMIVLTSPTCWLVIVKVVVALLAVTSQTALEVKFKLNVAPGVVVVVTVLNSVPNILELIVSFAIVVGIEIGPEPSKLVAVPTTSPEVAIVAPGCNPDAVPANDAVPTNEPLILNTLPTPDVTVTPV